MPALAHRHRLCRSIHHARQKQVPPPWPCQTTLRGKQGGLELAAAGGADRRSAKNPTANTAWINRAKRTAPPRGASRPHTHGRLAPRGLDQR